MILFTKTSQIETGWLVYAPKLVYITDQLDLAAPVVFQLGGEPILTPLLDYHFGVGKANLSDSSVNQAVGSRHTKMP